MNNERKDSSRRSRRSPTKTETTSPSAVALCARYCLDFGVFCKAGKIDVECDGETYHGSKEAQTRDRHRNNELTSYGWSVLRFSGPEINADTPGCIDHIERTIGTLGGLDTTWKDGR